jgi:uncharacterized protein DUF4158
MPAQRFTEVERARRNRFPWGIGQEDLIKFFRLSDADRAQISIYTAAHNRLGYALQLCALRVMGFMPDDLTSVPPATVAFLARQRGGKGLRNSRVIHNEIPPFLDKERAACQFQACVPGPVGLQQSCQTVV